MSPVTSQRKAFVDPVVSAPIDALDATRVFGGLLGQVILPEGSSALLDDGDADLPSPPYGPDASYIDVIDGSGGG